MFKLTFFLVAKCFWNKRSLDSPLSQSQVQVEETIVKVPKIMQTVQHLTFQAQKSDQDHSHPSSFQEAFVFLFLFLPCCHGPNMAAKKNRQDQIQKIEVVKPQIIQRTVQRKKPIIQVAFFFCWGKSSILGWTWFS